MNAQRQPLLDESVSDSRGHRSSLIRYYPDTLAGGAGFGSEDEEDLEEREAQQAPRASHNGNDNERLFKDPEGRAPKDAAFALLFALAMLAFVVAAVNAVRIAKHEEGEELRKSVFAAFKNCAAVLLGVSAASVLAGICWIMAMSAFVRPIVWGSIIAIPILCLGCFTFILTDALLGKANDPIYLEPQYNWMIALSVIFLMAAVVSGSFLYSERRNIDKAINIIHLACQILWETPNIFTLSLGIMGIYAVFSFSWAFAFSHLFLTRDPSAPPVDGLSTSTEGAVLYFIFIHFWFTAVLSSVEKMTIAGVVGQWYFGRTIDETYDDDLVAKSLKGSLNAGFGSICLASLVVAIVEVVQFAVKTIKKNSRGQRNSQTPFLTLLDSCLDCTGRAVSQISSYTLIYCGLTGAGVCEGAVSCTRLFRRNLVVGMATAGITRTLLFFGASVASGGVGAGTFFYAARGVGSPYAWVVGGVGAFVPFYVVRFMSQIIQNTVDATFICYMLDVDSNANNCQEAHEIFENDLGI